MNCSSCGQPVVPQEAVHFAKGEVMHEECAACIAYAIDALACEEVEES